jgi:hypothetical protein
LSQLFFKHHKRGGETPALADQGAVDRLQIVERDRGVNQEFEQSRAAARRSETESERLFRVVRAQYLQSRRRRFETYGVRQRAPADDHKQ